MLKHASWIHGNALVVEDPNHVLVTRRGNGAELQFVFPSSTTPKGIWCHIGIPTPVIINDVRMKVENLFLLFETGQHAVINNVHIYDGPERIAAWDVVEGGNYSARRSGTHSRSIDSQNTFTLPSPHEVRFGLSISFTFAPAALNNSIGRLDTEGRLLITTAGADFF